MTTKLFAEDDVERRIDFAESLETVTQTYVEAARDRVLNPPKLGMHMGDDGEWPELNAFAIDMPAYVDWLKVAGLKWAVATWDGDTDRPISSLILLFDVEDGVFKAVMEGMYLTGVRTALQSVVGLDRLAPSPPASVGLFGAGFQARFQVAVIDELLDVAEIRVFDTDRATGEAFVRELDPELGVDLVVADRPRAAARSDAVITATNAQSPVVDDRWLEETDLVVALGSYQELADKTILEADHVIVDHAQQCLNRGALASMAERDALGRTDLDATIGEILDGEYSGVIQADDRTLFVPIGVGAVDVALAEQVYAASVPRGSIGEFAFV
ncbi:ornithine cyclodeaminase family protein [Natronococcus jeotgali]|uniref:Ornithine cyclodeaminase, mu-crystallin n=1 Tax=Natronococcus jeotgali DSM 18795 TaxID=1227498 RepID=L9XK71_9EURY|nr:ornithine cyclodeaminase family protein [Natronococcus jeotgali]ELY61977.1 ornithine cyclodeaminase, mu-crystallin [Natronococcus jeotgali DSM 18795]